MKPSLVVQDGVPYEKFSLFISFLVQNRPFPTSLHRPSDGVKDSVTFSSGQYKLRQGKGQAEGRRYIGKGGRRTRLVTTRVLRVAWCVSDTEMYLLQLRRGACAEVPGNASIPDASLWTRQTKPSGPICLA